MKEMRKLVSFVLLLAVSGCVTLPAGPSVNVLPGEGKPFEQFQKDDMICRQWAERQLGQPVQEVREQNTATGAVAGTAIGAGLGAALGSASHHAGAGAAIGAATGLLFGTAIGAGEGEQTAYQAQRRYDNAYVQCMYSYGNQIPGRHVPTKNRQYTAPPPPAPAPPVTAVTPPPAAVVAPPPPVTAPAPAAVVERSRSAAAEAPPATVIESPEFYDTAPPAAVVEPPPTVTPAPVTVVQPPPTVVVAQPGTVVITREYYPAPPEVAFQEPPQFVYSPAMNMYVAVGTPYDVVYTGSEYLYFYDGRWYHSRYCNGPWMYAPRERYATFYNYRMDRIRHFREAEFRRYQRDKRYFNGRLHRPQLRERNMEHMSEGRRERR